MASNGRELLLNEVGLSTAKAGGKKSLPSKSTSFVGVLIVTNQAGFSYTVKIQHSPDGSTWIDLGTFALAAGNGVSLLTLAEPILTQVRADVSGVAGSGDVSVDIRYDSRS